MMNISFRESVFLRSKNENKVCNKPLCGKLKRQPICYPITVVIRDNALTFCPRLHTYD
jgi:hypothetical protein